MPVRPMTFSAGLASMDASSMAPLSATRTISASVSFSCSG